MITLTRRYRFSASHRLHSDAFSPEENQRLFGKCNNPYGHGHDYTLDVSVTGLADPETGLLVRGTPLDELVHDKVLRVMSSRYLNLDVPEFQRIIPTTEHVVLVIRDVLLRHWSEYMGNHQCHLRAVHVRETDRNSFTSYAGAPDQLPALQFEESSVNA
jgi:6-pyruvoyltetrahydropterin/6-carboxytetrahydropterin synthase